FGVVPGFETGGRRSEHDHRTCVPSADDGDVATMVARCVLLLVALIVLFIDYDQPEITHGREDAGAGRYHDASFARAYPAPLLGALGIVKCRVQNRNPAAEAVMELTGDGRGERDLRNQQQCTAP